MAEELNYKITGDASGLKKSLQEAFLSTEELEGAVKSLVKALGPIALAFAAFEGVKDVLKDSVNAFKDSQLAAHDLALAVNTSGGLGKDFRELQEQAERLSKTGTFSQKEIERAQTMALQTGLVSSQVQKLIPIAADLSAKLLSPSGAKMNLDEIQGHIDRFLKTGKDKQLRLIGAEGGKNLEERLAILQKIGLAAKGSDANLAATTLEGALKNLYNTLEPFLVTIGNKLNDIFILILPYVNKLFDGIKSVFDFLGTHSDALLNIFRKVETFVQPFVDLFESAFNELKQPVIDLFLSFVRYMSPLVDLFKFLKPYLLELGNGIIGFSKIIVNFLTHIYKIGYSIYQILDKLGAFKLIGKIFNGVWQIIKSIGGFLQDIYNKIIVPLFDKIEGALNLIKGLLHIKDSPSIKSDLIDLFSPNKNKNENTTDAFHQTFGGTKLSPDLNASSVSSSEKARENITLNITKLVEHLDIHTTTINGGAEEISRAVSEILQQAVNNVRYAGHQ